jgi:phosphoglycerate kinase
MQKRFRTLDDLDVTGKKVLVRMDMNVPMLGGRVRDFTRIERQLPTLRDLRTRGAKTIILSHFGRPKEDKYDPALSLAALVDPLAEALGATVKFGRDCVGLDAHKATVDMQNGDIVLLENLRFHPEEKKNDPAFVQALASLGEIYVNDAFSCSHRAHASLYGLAQALPNAAGRAMQAELQTLEAIFDKPQRPIAAIIGGAKVSTKLAVLEHLVQKVDVLMIGGAMAHTFLKVQGGDVGASLLEEELVPVAAKILAAAKQSNCRIVLPVDVAAAEAFAPHAPNTISDARAIETQRMALDIGIDSLLEMIAALRDCRTLVWNGPLGAFETAPFDVSTVVLARAAAKQTQQGLLYSVAGGGDTLAALKHAGLSDSFSYLSTAGGAFLEWMEGKELPGVAVLNAA